MDKESFEGIKRGLEDVLAFQKGNYRGARVHVFDDEGNRAVLDGNKEDNRNKIRRAVKR